MPTSGALGIIALNRGLQFLLPEGFIPPRVIGAILCQSVPLLYLLRQSYCGLWMAQGRRIPAARDPELRLSWGCFLLPIFAHAGGFAVVFD